MNIHIRTENSSDQSCYSCYSSYTTLSLSNKFKPGYWASC